jgi:hypothetical protein
LILIGCSQSGKTPLSLHLAMEGLKVSNVTVGPTQSIPEAIEHVDHNKIFALIIDPPKLSQIAQYTQLSEEDIHKISEEQSWWRTALKQYRRWPTINMTEKTLEETAADIQRVLAMRKSNISKQDKRFI